ncbi:hypothetical protein FHX82_002191 [Amycolatopsis bartoniae]|uniref:DUF4244 domain-containing protein n=1 Tax=Amycolatopsis bartoniae TaxID=941986 RepID=A0A8H9MCW1_9PSEU|nr:DUF4244 domain-containing protein [Amycolatopsis bartoniae]MBB2935171.1 hypothetical protein [Amycolatopsis bartoniae]TVT07040.1 DUF4244 domain-containing protein [Amycolatopsis bartoniae]GHF74865.1 hypothetical protein GCM10017566_55890 [Amycolatopsis bartoniae]
MYWQTTGRHVRRKIRWWHRWLRPQLAGDDGTVTIEYAICTVGAAALAAALYTLVTGQSVVSALADLVMSSMQTPFS